MNEKLVIFTKVCHGCQLSSMNLLSMCWWRSNSLASEHPYWKAFVYSVDAFYLISLLSDVYRLFILCSNATYFYESSFGSRGCNSNLTSVYSLEYIFFLSHPGVIASLLIWSTWFASRWLKITLKYSTGCSGSFCAAAAELLAFMA